MQVNSEEAAAVDPNRNRVAELSSEFDSALLLQIPEGTVGPVFRAPQPLSGKAAAANAQQVGQAAAVATLAAVVGTVVAAVARATPDVAALRTGEE